MVHGYLCDAMIENKVYHGGAMAAIRPGILVRAAMELGAMGAVVTWLPLSTALVPCFPSGAVIPPGDEGRGGTGGCY